MQNSIDELLRHSPNLKAREIANKLGLERKSVSSFLHSNKHIYQQDEESRWSLVGQNSIRFSLPSSWVTADDFETCFCEVGPLHDSIFNNIEFKFPKGCNLMIDSLARILALGNQLANRGKTVTFDFSDCYRTFTYLDRNGFFNLLDENINVKPKRPDVSAADNYRNNTSSLVEFDGINLGTDNDELKERLTNVFVRESSSSYLSAAYTVFGEFIENVKEHSQTGLIGFAGLQKYEPYSGRKHIQSVISDSGIGIANSLRPSLKEHHKELYPRFKTATLENDIALVIEAMTKGNISSLGEGRGLGFKSNKELALKFNARYTVRQPNFSLEFQFDNGQLVSIKKRECLPLLLGTHICFDFYID